MPASKKDLRNKKQRQNKEAGVGDKDGKLVSQKPAQVKAKCKICLQEIIMVKEYNQAKSHAETKHNKPFSECFPGF